MELGRTKVGKVRSRQMKLHRFKRILKKDELLTIEAYANDKVNAVLEQIRDEIERATIEMDYDTAKEALAVIDRYK
jgi:hypothetical protein